MLFIQAFIFLIMKKEENQEGNNIQLIEKMIDFASAHFVRIDLNYKILEKLLDFEQYDII